MSLSLLFWVIYIVWIVFGFYRYRSAQFDLGYHGIIVVLFFIIGWRVFGFPIHA